MACFSSTSTIWLQIGTPLPPPTPHNRCLETQPEPYLIIIAYLGMVIFAAVSMGAWNFTEPKSVALYSRVLLALGGMFVVALSTVACLGFISAIGINLTPLSVRRRLRLPPSHVVYFPYIAVRISWRYAQVVCPSRLSPNP